MTNSVQATSQALSRGVVWEFVSDWLDRGVRHGFYGVGAEASAPPSWPEPLKILRQVHGAVIVAHGEQGAHVPPEADGWLSDRRPQQPCALAIRTADCVPVLMICGEHRGAVHAGWRGIANGIVLEACRRITAGQGAELEIALGPAAGAERYEVGEDVIDALGPCAVVHRGERPGHWYLDLRGSIVKQVDTTLGVGSARWFLSQSCTMSDQAFNSYRRDRDRAGRNISFIAA